MSAIGSRYAIACGLLVTIVGAAYAMKNDLPWLAFCLLLPLTFSALCAARTWWREAQEAHQRYVSEQTQHEATRHKAERAATEVMGNVRALLRQYGLGSATDIIRRSVHLLDRMKSLQSTWKSPPVVRKITQVGQQLYATVKVPLPAIAHIGEGDTFVLVEACKDNVRCKIAMLQVNQEPDPKKGVVILVVTDILNSDTIEALRLLAQSTKQPPSGFTIDLPFDTRPFGGQDLAAADALLSAMTRELNDVYLAEVQNG